MYTCSYVTVSSELDYDLETHLWLVNTIMTHEHAYLYNWMGCLCVWQIRVSVEPYDMFKYTGRVQVMFSDPTTRTWLNFHP